MNESTLDFSDRPDEIEHEPISESEPSSPYQECKEQIIRDENHSERACEECGLVLDIEALDHGPEWQAFFADRVVYE